MLSLVVQSKVQNIDWEDAVEVRILGRRQLTKRQQMQEAGSDTDAEAR